MRLVVDTSVLIALLRAEDDAPHLLDAIAMAERRLLSAGSYLEAGIVMTRSDGGLSRLQSLIRQAEIDVVPVSETEARIGVQAYQRYGRGSGHAARLNFGDCFAYALAKTHDLPLLFKGDDFIHTDVEPAAKPA